MLGTGVFCFLFILQINAYPAFQNWCFGQQRQAQPQQFVPAPSNGGNMCNQAFRQYTTPCGYRQPTGNPLNYPSPYQIYSNYPSGLYWPGETLPGSQQQQQTWPWPWQVVSSRPVYPSEVVTEEPTKVYVQNPYYPPQKEWVCPTDPEPRARSIAKENEPDLQECLYDENCPSAPIRQKCCYDSGIGGKVCKPAIPV